MSSGETLSTDEVAHLARLARLDLSEAELARYAGQLDQILHAVDRVGEVAADEIVPMSHPQPLTNVWRPDVVAPSLGTASALSAAPATESERFVVPKILDGDQ